MRFYKTKNSIRKQNQKILDKQQRDISSLEAEIVWLKDVLIEARIIQDVPTNYQRTRTVTGHGGWGLPYNYQQAYVVNPVKPKGKK